MKYVQIQTADVVVDHVVDVLSSHLLTGKRVAWLLSGGSAIELEVRIAQALMALDTTRLTISLVDERYGPLGHEDESYSKLIAAGFPLPMKRVLIGAPPQETTQSFAHQLKVLLDEADFSLGFFGIGADGHTAGIKPLSPSVDATDLATYYKWDDYERITMTIPAIRRLDEAIVYATGTEKADTLRALLYTDQPLIEHPAQVLKEVATSTLYTDVLL